VKSYKKALILFCFLGAAASILSLFVGIKVGILLVLLGFLIINVTEALTRIVHNENKRLNLKVVHIVAGTILGFLSLKEEEIGLGIAFTSLLIYLTYLLLSEKVTKEETPYINLFKELGLDQKRAFNVTFGLISINLTYLIFSNPVSSTSVLAFALGDGIGGLYGRLYGKTKLPYNKNKTMEGTIFELIFLVILFSLMTRNIFHSLTVAVLLTLIETLPVPINDNLFYPLVAGLLQSLVFY
jgi:dolichol kinase